MDNLKRLNLKLTATTDKKLRDLAKQTGLKMVTIISKGIEQQYTSTNPASHGMDAPRR